MTNNSYLGKLTAYLCDLYETRVSDIAWKRFKIDFREWFGLPVPYLTPEDYQYIYVIEKWCDYRLRHRENVWWDKDVWVIINTKLVQEHPNYQELKKYGYV